MDDAFKIQISTSFHDGMIWLKLLCAISFLFHLTESRSRGTGLKLIAGFSLETCPKWVEWNQPEFRQCKSSFEQSFLELARCSSSPDWRLKPFTHGEQTSTHCLNFKAFAIIFSTIITYKAFILCKFQTFNQRHLTFSMPPPMLPF